MIFPVTLEQQIIFIIHITITMFLSMLIGINRERYGKSAGLRTHMLTGVGACLFTILSLHAFPDSDPSRVASNVVTGIGFLGAGLIIQRKRETHDLTTAAGIWATAAVGMAVGAGLWLLAMYTTGMIWIVLEVFQRLKATVVAMEESEEDADENETILTDMPARSPSLS